MPFELTHPAGLFLLAALAPLVALYVLKSRRVRHVVPSVWLWQAARREVLARKPFKRLLPETSLLLEALAIVLFAVALSAPSCSGVSARRERVALVVDTSASMAARGPGGTRMDAAKAAARSLLSRSVPPAEVMLIDAGAEPRVVLGLERDARRLLRAVDSLAVRDEEGTLGAAVALAVERFRAAPGPSRVIVVTDTAGEMPEATGAPLEVHRVGAPSDNVAILRTDVRRKAAPGEPERVEIFVALANLGDKAVDGFVTVRARAGGPPLAARSVALGARERASTTLGFAPGPDDTGKGLVVELTPGDAFPTDDRAYAVVPPGPRLPVVLVPRAATAGGSPWLARAFAADDSVELFEGDLDAALRGELPADALTVITGECPKTPPLGDLLVIGPKEGDCLGVRVGKRVSRITVTSWADRDPRLRFLSLDALHVHAGSPLDAPRSAALVRAGDAVIAADLGLPGRTGTVLSFDLKDTDWPLDASFVVFVRNVTERAREGRLRAVGGATRTGRALSLPIRAGARSVSVVGPGGDLPARLIDSVAIAGAPPRAGFYDVVDDDTGKILATAAVNLWSERESDLGGRTAGGARSGAASTTGVAASRASIGFALALAGLCAVLLDAFWITRRPRRAKGAGPSRSRLLASLPLPSRVALAASLAPSFGFAGYALLVRLGAVSDRFLRLERPEWTIAGVAAVVFLGVRAALSPPDRGPIRRALVEGGLGLAALAAALAAAEPSLGSAFDRLAVIVAVDRSRSLELSPGAEARIERELEQIESRMRPDDRLGVVGFALGAALEQTPRRREEPRSPQRAPLSRDGTDLAAGLQRALSEAPSDAAARVVVITDGVATRGNVDEALVSATIGGVPVDTLALEQRPVNNVRLQGVRAPARADANEAIDLRITTRSTVTTEVDVEVLRDGQRTSLTRRRVPAGEDVLYVREDAGAPGLHRYEVRVVPADPSSDTVLEDDRATTFVRVKGPSRALVLESDEAAAAPLRAALEAASFLVDVVSATRSPETLLDLARYDFAVLGALPAYDFSPEQLAALASYVQDLGGGLLLLGSDRSLGPGGYARTKVEDVSPLAFDLPNERRRARLAEVILVDYSGSMGMEVGGRTKLALANEAAARSGELLGAGDRLGVAHVDTQVSWTLPIAPAGAPENGRRIRSVTTGGGGIYVDIALDTAYRALEREAVELKHVLLFADGSDAEQRERAPSMAETAARHGTTTSVVALGRGQDVPGLEKISRLGKGRFYLIEDARRLPAVFAQETTTAAGNAISEVTFRPAVRYASEALRGFDPAALPPLTGYVVTTKKARATTLLDAADGDPLLATWSAGLGRSATFTSDYGRKWGASWAGSREAAQLFAQLARELTRRPDDPRFTVEADTSLGVLDIRAARVDDDPAAPTELSATVGAPDGTSQTVPLRENGPGTYHAAVPLTRAGSYVVSVIDDEGRRVIATTGATLSSAEELEATGTDHGLLARIARSTGGISRTTLAGVFDDRLASRGSYLPLAPWLSGLAAFLLLSSVAARRLSLPRPAWLRRLPRRATASAPRSSPDGASAPDDPAPPEPVLGAEAANGAEARAARPAPPAAEPRPPAEPAVAKTTAEELLRRRKRRE